jgi:hypothetical protein
VTSVPMRRTKTNTRYHQYKRYNELHAAVVVKPFFVFFWGGV